MSKKIPPMDRDTFYLMYGNGGPQKDKVDGFKNHLPRGRRTKFHEIDLDRVKFLVAVKGFTDAELCHVMDIAPGSWEQWKAHRPDFAEALRDWKETANSRIERSMYEAARGYTCDETKVFNNNGQIIEKTVKKHFPPNVRAGTIFLTNRRPKQWKEKVNHEMSGPDGGPIETSAPKININFVDTESEDSKEK